MFSFIWMAFSLHTTPRSSGPRAVSQSNNNKKNRRRKEEERGEGEEERRRRGRRKFLKLFQSYIKVGINIIGY